MDMGRYSRVVPAVAIALIGVALYPVAHAAIVGEYGQWTVSGKTGTVFAPDAHFPTGSVSSNAGSFRVFSGKSAYLNDSTPVGQQFGSSKGHDYLQFNAVSAAMASKTTISFDTPAPAHQWAFVLGDIDADQALIEAIGTNGKELTPAELGWKGAFNYCDSTPRPSSCTGGPFTDKPVWHASNATLTGNGPDTSGASGWFMPAKAVKSLTIVYSVLHGSPIGQLWVAAKWPGERPDIVIAKHASPTDVLPGGRVNFRITVTNVGSVPEPMASFRDDLSDVLDDAHYLGDAHADGGLVSYRRPILSWEGPVPPHETRTISYSIRIDNPVRGNGRISNVVIGEGRRATCQGGKGAGCSVIVHVAVTLPCRAALPGAITRDAC
jgi:hypothetical protein